MTETRSNAIIALGSNLPSSAGDSVQTLGRTLETLGQRGMTLRAVSRFFKTPCFPAGTGPNYVNAAVSVSFRGHVADVLTALHDIEHQFGRARVQRWGMRTLDLDLLAVDDLILPDAAHQRHWMTLPDDVQATEMPEQLILPHPRIQDRAFVLIPLADIEPDWVHPVLHKTVIEMCNDLPETDIAAVRPL